MIISFVIGGEFLTVTEMNLSEKRRILRVASQIISSAWDFQMWTRKSKTFLREFTIFCTNEEWLFCDSVNAIAIAIQRWLSLAVAIQKNTKKKYEFQILGVRSCFSEFLFLTVNNTKPPNKMNLWINTHKSTLLYTVGCCFRANFTTES